MPTSTEGASMSALQLSRHEDLISYLRRIRRLLTTKELSIVLGKHPETIYRMVASGFPAVRDGGRWKFDSVKVADWLEKRTTQTCRRA
jgi:excisionase family DNA binding protein